MRVTVSSVCKKLHRLVGAVLVAAIVIAAPGIAGAQSFVQWTASGATASCVFSSPPANGDVVIVYAANNSVTVSDSNSVSLTNITGTTETTGSYFGYVVSGSPTKTYTLSTAVTNGCTEVSGVTTSGALFSGGTGSANSATTSAISFPNNSFALCAGNQTATGGTISYSSATISGSAVTAEHTLNGATLNYTADTYLVNPTSQSSNCTINFSGGSGTRTTTALLLDLPTPTPSPPNAILTPEVVGDDVPEVRSTPPPAASATEVDEEFGSASAWIRAEVFRPNFMPGAICEIRDDGAMSCRNRNFVLGIHA